MERVPAGFALDPTERLVQVPGVIEERRLLGRIRPNYLTYFQNVKASRNCGSREGKNFVLMIS
jgi:hypothetical protein